MRRKALLIRHMPDPRADRVSALLAAWGFDLDWRCPLEGANLPDVDEAIDLVVVYGGIQSANDAEREPAIRAEIDWIGRWVARGGAYLGLCLGGQLLARALDARVWSHRDGLHEIGFVEVSPAPGETHFLGATLPVYQWHYEGFDVPRGAELLAVGETFPNQAFRYADRAFALQFHPEVTAEIMAAWMREAAHMLDEPGAHPKKRQIADSRRHDGAMGAWLHGFLAALVETL